MIEAHDGVPGFQQPLRHVVVAAEVLAQPVDDDDCRLRLRRRGPLLGGAPVSGLADGLKKL